MPRIFLLSPANAGGVRAQQLLSPRAGFELAHRVQSPEGAQMGEVFAFVSGLYFRGKLTYAQRFADVGDHPARTELGGGVLVITPGAGLRSADTHVNAEALRLFAQIEIDLANPAYRTPLVASARRVARAERRPTSCSLGRSRHRSTSTCCWTSSDRGSCSRLRSSAAAT